MSDKELIKEEIERIIEEETPISKGSDYYHGAKESMNKLLQFIDHLSEEPNEDLEEAARKWEDTVYLGNGWQDEYGAPHAPFSEIGNAFIAGAEWADKHLRKGLWDSEKAIKFIKENVREYHKSGVFHVDDFINDLCKVMEE